VTGTADLRAAIIGLTGFAATAEQMLLAASPDEEHGDERNWAAAPLIAHNTEFKGQQVQRLRAIARGATPAEYAEIDHASAALYRGYASIPAGQVAQESCQVTAELIACLRATSDEDLLDPGRNPWLRGRQLWLQAIVRGFWHPTGHLAAYYLAHGQSRSAVALAAQGVVTADYVRAPDAARGMASYNLACAQARAGALDEAVAALTEAIRLNPDVRANAGRDPDLAALREAGMLASMLSG
jgi:tetratricopeptide (TPR) repeat protein